MSEFCAFRSSQAGYGLAAELDALERLLILDALALRALGDTPALRAWLTACAASVDCSRLSGNVRAVA